MPKIITVQRREGEHDKARDYVKTYILFPSSLLGLIFMVSGGAALIYQYISTTTYGWKTFVETVGLLIMGGVLGWGQTRYHRYLLRDHPEFFAARMRLFRRSAHKRARKEAAPAELNHPGRKLLPLAYILGIGAIVGTSAAAAMAGHTYYVAAFLLPWAGFFWAKMFFWRGLLQEGKARR